MKKYIKPAQQVSNIEHGQMLAESLAVNSGTTVDGDNALAKEAADWSMWGED